MPSTYTPLATTTLGSTQTTVTFSSIPGTYTDIIIIAVMRTTGANFQPILRFNSDSGSNYSSTTVWGDGSTAGSNRHSNQNGIYANPGAGIGTAGQFMPWIINVMNYANTGINKTTVERFNNTPSVVNAGVGLWRNTSAINSISLVAESGSNDFQIGSTFTLYGVKNA